MIDEDLLITRSACCFVAFLFALETKLDFCWFDQDPTGLSCIGLSWLGFVDVIIIIIIYRRLKKINELNLSNNIFAIEPILQG